MRSPSPLRPWPDAPGLVLAAVAAVTLIAAFAGALGGPAAPVPRDPPSLDLAVRRTLATGSARISGTITTPGGEPGTITGQTAFGRPESAFVVTAPGAAGAEAEVRVRPEGAWLRAPGATHWVAVDASLGGLGGDVRGAWDDVIAEVGRARDLRHHRGGRELSGRLGDRTVVVGLDGRGRIERLSVRGGTSRLDVRLDDLGAPVTVPAPFPVASIAEP